MAYKQLQATTKNYCRDSCLKRYSQFNLFSSNFIWIALIWEKLPWNKNVKQWKNDLVTTSYKRTEKFDLEHEND